MLAISTRITLKPGGILEFPEDCSLEELREFVGNLEFFRSELAAHLSSIRAQTARFGTQRFGSEAMLDLFADVPAAQLKKGGRVAQIPPSIREEHPGVSDKQWDAIAAETDVPAQVKRWATEASEHGLTPTELRVSVRTGAVVKERERRKQTGFGSGIVTIQGIVVSFQQWMRRSAEEIFRQADDGNTEVLREIWRITEPLREFLDKVEEALGKGAD